MANAEQALPRAYDLVVYGASGFTGHSWLNICSALTAR